MRKAFSWLFIVLLPLIATGSVYMLRRDLTARNHEWPTQMQYSPAAHPQTANAVLPMGMTQQPPVAGTIPRGFQPFHYSPGKAEELRAGSELTNPFQPTEENLKRGQQVYTNHCVVCHGTGGAGDGPVIPKYPNPPNYNSDNSKALPDGSMFHVITTGRLNMPSHAAQVKADDRWKAILYIRKLQGMLR